MAATMAARGKKQYDPGIHPPSGATTRIHAVAIPPRGWEQLKTHGAASAEGGSATRITIMPRPEPQKNIHTHKIILASGELH
jgi:hypothetical protein